MRSKHIFTLTLIFCSLLSYSGMAQSAKSAYFMRTSQTRNYMNPALNPEYGYVGFPLLNNIYGDMKTNTFCLENFIFTSKGKQVTFMHPDISERRFLSGISANNFISVQANYDMISMGFTGRKHYINVHLGLRSQVDLNVPGSVFRLLKNGFNQSGETNYNLSDLTLSAKAYLELGFGYTRLFLDDHLRVSLRPKLLIGTADFDLYMDRLNVSASAERWHISSKAYLKGSAPGITAKYKTEEDGSEKLDGFDFDWNGLPGYGGGVDIGFSYHFEHLAESMGPGLFGDIIKNLRLSCALNDLGFLYWSGSNTVAMQTHRQDITINPSDYTIYQDGSSSLENIFDDLIDDLEKGIDLHDDPSAKGTRKTKLNRTIFAGAEYDLIDEISVGFLYTNRKNRYNHISEYTASANFRPAGWFGVSVSYSFVEDAYNTLGYAIHLSPRRGLGLFIASDYAIPSLSKQWLPARSKGMNIQFGLAINTGAKKVYHYSCRK